MSDFDLLGSLSGNRGEDRVGSEPTPGHQCSRRGCRARAAWAVLWNNPKVHTPERRKTWLACDVHRDWLADYLDQRGFLKAVEPFDAAQVGDATRSPDVRQPNRSTPENG